MSAYKHVQLFLILPLLLLTFGLSGLSFLPHAAIAQEVTPVKIVEFEVSAQDGQAVSPDDPLMTGAVYQIAFAIDVGTSVKDQLVLSTQLERTGDRYWNLTNEDYEGVDVNTWQPGRQEISFQPVEGIARFSLTGRIPEEYTRTPLETGEILHNAKSIQLLELSLGTSGFMEERKSSVIDDSIAEYRKQLEIKESLLEEVDGDPGYESLVKGIIGQAKAEANDGYTRRAVELLQTIPESGWTQPRGSNMLFIVIAAVLAVIALIAIVLVFRSRSEAQFLKKQSDAQAKKLELVSTKVSKLGDKGISEEVNRVKDELRSMSGR
ncbi:MAG: hypothetical protein ACOC7P_00345 [Chloroflexota bacterium]